jgi:UrcA family protein
MIATLFHRTLSVAIAAGATVLIVAGSAAPVSAETAPVARISTAGIDLASPAGMARANADVMHAARRVCSTGNDRSAGVAQARRDCIVAAVAAAKPRLEALAAAQHDAREALADSSAPAKTVLR